MNLNNNDILIVHVCFMFVSKFKSLSKTFTKINNCISIKTIENAYKSKLNNKVVFLYILGRSSLTVKVQVRID